MPTIVTATANYSNTPPIIWKIFCVKCHKRKTRKHTVIHKGQYLYISSTIDIQIPINKKVILSNPASQKANTESIPTSRPQSELYWFKHFVAITMANLDYDVVQILQIAILDFVIWPAECKESPN